MIKLSECNMQADKPPVKGGSLQFDNAVLLVTIKK